MLEEIHLPVTDGVPTTVDELYVGKCRCGTRWQGEAIAHCGSCHLTFTTVGNFDAHLDGRRNPVPGCRTEAEMRERGYEPNAAGHWRKPMPEGKTPWAATR
jgi:hypothetical protein